MVSCQCFQLGQKYFLPRLGVQRAHGRQQILQALEDRISISSTVGLGQLVSPDSQSHHDRCIFQQDDTG